MSAFDMNTMPRTSLRAIRALASQSAANGRAEEITVADAQYGRTMEARVTTASYASVKVKAEKL